MFNSFNPLSKRGEYEVLIFSGFYLLSLKFKERKDFISLSNAYSMHLIKKWKEFEIGYFKYYTLSNLIGKRKVMYDQELLSMRNNGLLGKAYSAMYEKPLNNSPTFSENLPSVVLFSSRFGMAVKFLSEADSNYFSSIGGYSLLSLMEKVFIFTEER